MNRSRILIGIIGAALLAVCGLCALTGYGIYAWFNTNQANVRFFDVANVSSTVTELDTYEAKPSLVLHSDRGNITVLAGEGSQIEVEMVKTGWGTTQAEAEAAANALQVSVQETTQTLEFTFNMPEEFGVFVSRAGNDKVDFTIRLPAETAVEINSGFGDVTLAGLAQKVVVDNSFGTMSVKDVAAGENNLQLVTSFGDVTVENCQGEEIYVESSNGKIIGRDLAATSLVEVKNTFGTIELENITAADLTVSGQNGEIHVAGGIVEDEVGVTNAFGDIHVEQMAASSYNIKNNNGSIQLENAEGLLKITSQFGGIEISSAENATLELVSENGDVEFSGSLNSDADHAIKNNFGDVTLTLPEMSAFDLELNTSFGDITSDIPVTLTGKVEETSWEAQINGGGKMITATTSNGNITLHVLASEE